MAPDFCRDDRVKTETLPHRHPARRTSAGAFRTLAALLLATAWLPALAVQPASRQDTDTSFDTATPTLNSQTTATATAIPAALALPVASQAPVLPAPSLPALASELSAPPIAAALVTPDTNARGARTLAPTLAPQQTPATATTADRSLVRTVLQRAFTLLGTPYRWGGSSPESGFDCSGLVGYVFRTIGIDLPRVSRAMAGEGTAVTDRNSLAEGDLVFFGRRGRVDHVGIYIGNGKFLHAPRTGRDVTVSDLSTGYWSQKFLEARRLAVGG